MSSPGLALLADRRDMQKAFRAAWAMPYVVVPMATKDGFPCVPLRSPQPGPHDLSMIAQQNIDWAHKIRLPNN